jgi:hypothetical protein
MSQDTDDAKEYLSAPVRRWFGWLDSAARQTHRQGAAA